MRALLAAATIVYGVSYGPSNVYADGLHVLPPWHMTDQEACYGFDDAQKLFALDEEVWTDRSRCDLVAHQRDDLQKVVAAQTQQMQVEADENKRLSQELNDAIKGKNDALAKAGGSTTTWLVVGGAGALVLGILLDAYIVHLR